MSAKYVVVSGALFGVVSVLQAVRALKQWPVLIGPFEIPVWVSWIVMVVTGSLCLWAWQSRGK